MRICILAYGLHRGGRSRIICRLANGLASRGHEVSLVLLTGQPIAYPLDVPVHRVSGFREAAIPAADLVVPTSVGLVPVAMESANAVTVPLYTRFDPDVVYDYRSATRILALPVPSIATSGPLAERLQQLSGRPCYVAHPGVDTAVFHPSLAQGQVPSNRIGYLYRAEALGYGYKASGDLFEAMQLVRQHEPNMELSLVAPDGLPVDCPVPHRVEAVQSDLQLAEFYRRSRLFVAASRTDGYLLSALEAMACGVPVVLTDCGGVRDYATPGVNCFMGLAGNVKMLADLILAALLRPDMAETFVAKGLETARARTWDRFVQEAEQALLSRAKAPA